jgi:hypothetical protein
MYRESSLLSLRLSFMESETRRVGLAKNRAKNSLLPVGRLPDEVLSEILLLSVVPIEYDLWASPILSTCHRWRQCAIRNPKIWSVISIDYCTELDELELWLSRSASCPLHIQFFYEQDVPPEEIMRHFTAAYEVTSNRHCRVRSLHIEGITSLETLLPLKSLGTSLRELVLASASDKETSNVLPVLEELASSHIHSLTINNLPPCRNAVRIDDINPSNLTSLTLNQAVTVQSVCKILPRCQSLVYLKWSYAEAGELNVVDSLQWMTEPFLLRNLKSLFISGSMSIPLLQMADMPELGELSVTSPMRPMGEIVHHLIRWERLEALELLSLDAVESQHFTTIFETLNRLEWFKCDAWTVSSLCGLYILINHSKQRVGGARRFHCPHLRNLIIGFAYSSLQSDEDDWLLRGALQTHILPLTHARGPDYEQPLTVWLPNIYELVAVDSYGDFDSIDHLHCVRLGEDCYLEEER